jgi:hypothetical protein
MEHYISLLETVTLNGSRGMLLYHPAYDVYHCVFRVLRLLEADTSKTIEIDRLRVLDFYLLFPSLLSELRFPRSASKYKKAARSISTPYENIENPYRVFIQLEPFQQGALRCLVSCGLLDSDNLKDGFAKRTQKILPTPLADSIKSANEADHDLIGLFTGPLFDLDFYGPQGLKARTSLLEYRYDS